MILSKLYPDVGVIVSGEGDIANLDIKEVLSVFARHGAVLFRGFDVDRVSFDRFSISVAPDLISHPNTAREMLGDRTMTKAAPGAGHFFAHSELGYTPLRPDLAWFYCQRPANSGGETVMYDGLVLLDRLPSKTRELFEKSKILFEYSISSETWAIMSQYSDRLDRCKDFKYKKNDRGGIDGRFVTSAIVETRYDGRPAFCNSLLDSREPRFEDGTKVPQDILFDIIATSEELSLPIRWQVGDVLLLDNTRFMHGRRPFDDPQRDVIVRFANLD